MPEPGGYVLLERPYAGEAEDLGVKDTYPPLDLFSPKKDTH